MRQYLRLLVAFAALTVGLSRPAHASEERSFFGKLDDALGAYIVAPLAQWMFWDVMFWDNTMALEDAAGLRLEGSVDEDGVFSPGGVYTEAQAAEIAAAGELSANFRVTEATADGISLQYVRMFRTSLLRPSPVEPKTVVHRGVELEVMDQGGTLSASIQAGDLAPEELDIGDSPLGIPDATPLSEWVEQNPGRLLFAPDVEFEGLVVSPHIGEFPVVLRDGPGPWEVIPTTFLVSEELWPQLLPIETGSEVRAENFRGTAESFNSSSDGWTLVEHRTHSYAGTLANPNNKQFPLVVIWLVLGAIYFTLRMQFINLRGFTHAIRVTKGDFDDPGEISHFQALSAALSATVGLGNIAGVAIAVGLGGPGAVFWMVMAGFLGMSSKFTECSLGQMYRTVDSNGHVLGGPMRYLGAGLTELGRPRLGRFLAVMFALLCIGGSLGGGNMFQANQSAAAIGKVVPIIGGERAEASVVLARDLEGSTLPTLETIEIPKDTSLTISNEAGESFTFRTTQNSSIPSGSQISAPIPVLAVDGGYVNVPGDASWSVMRIPGVSNGRIAGEQGIESGSAGRSWLYGLTIALFVGLVILGGIKRIGAAAGRIVPVMCGIYVLAGAWILLANASQVGPAFMKIVTEAFTPAAVGYGGLIGVLVQGFKRAAFSNEAGTGSASIAHSAAATSEPVREGIVALLEPFVDTLIVCTMTGLVVVLTGTYQTHAGDGVLMTSAAFETVLPWFPLVLSIAVMLFAFSTMISWSYYGERCATFLFGAKASVPYKLLFIFCTFIGAVIPLGNVLDFSDLMILGMAFPNVFGLWLLSGKVKEELDTYWAKLKNGEFKTQEA